MRQGLESTANMDSNRDMLGVGTDINIPDKKNIAAKRLKRGECATCGIKTHKIGLFGKKTPLNIPGSVQGGRCLACNPVGGVSRRNVVPQPSYQPSQQPSQQQSIQPSLQQPQQQPQPSLQPLQQQQQQPPPQLSQQEQEQLLFQQQMMMQQQQQQQLLMHQNEFVPREVVHFDENASVVSGITLDFHLQDNYYDDEYAHARRPEAIGEDQVEEHYGGIGGFHHQPRMGQNRFPRPPNGRDFSGMHQHPPPPSSGYGRGGGGFSPIPEHSYKRDGRGPGKFAEDDGQPISRMGQDYHDQLHDHRDTLLDEDGYPRAGAGRGWDKQADMLPPGGMDALFSQSNPSQPYNNATHGNIPNSSGEEIQFQPVGRGGPGPRGRSVSPHPQETTTNDPVAAAPQSSQMPLSRSPRDGRDYFPSYENDMMHAVNLGSQMGSNTRGSLISVPPPLKSRSERGRPDDDILDPMAGLPGPSASALPSRGPSRFTPPPSASEPISSRFDRPKGGAPAQPPPRRPVSPEGMAMSPPQQLHDFGNGAGAGAGVPQSSPPTAIDDPFGGFQRSVPPAEQPRMPAPAPAATLKATSDHNDEPYEPSSDNIAQMVRVLSNEPPQTSQQPSDRGPKGGRRRRENNNTNNNQIVQKEQTINDIPVILHCMNLDEANPFLRERALRSLAEIVYKSGSRAKDLIVKHKGLETLTNSMWIDMGTASVQDAAAQFLLSMAASTDGNPSSDSLANADGAIDALLISMQSHGHVEGIQLAGCGTLYCLASASSNNQEINDGTLSGALLMVLNAMDMHSRSLAVQKAGMRTLYAQCVLSANAESNKRNFVKVKVDGGGGPSGLDVWMHALELCCDDLVTVEYACRMCWCLSSSEDIASSLSQIPTVHRQMMGLAQSVSRKAEGAEIFEAVCGVLCNMSQKESLGRSNIIDAGAVPLMLDALRFYHSHVGVNVEACAALANFASGSSPSSNSIRESIIQEGGVSAVIRALQVFVNSEALVEEALRALVCLTINSPNGKTVIAQKLPEVVQTLSQATDMHPQSSLIQEYSASLIASLLSIDGGDPRILNPIMNNGGTDVVLKALKTGGSEDKLLEAVCLAYRNLACAMEDTDPLLRAGAIRKLVKIMESQEKSASIQSHACCALWNVAYKTNKEPGLITDSEGVKCIVRAMQCHMESSELLTFACGALWCLVDESIERKKDVVGYGAIDAVACALVMHPTDTKTLEKACGVLSNVSAEQPLAEAIANAQGISVVVEAMRNNSTSVDLLEIGANVLRNIITFYPQYTSDASGTVTSILKAMRENKDAADFQREACSLLWLLAAESENCHSKILALEGFDILMETLEHSSGIEDVKEAALGAVNQLTVNN